jgi:hypothetical protein
MFIYRFFYLDILININFDILDIDDKIKLLHDVLLVLEIFIHSLLQVMNSIGYLYIATSTI